MTNAEKYKNWLRNTSNDTLIYDVERKTASRCRDTDCKNCCYYNVNDSTLCNTFDENPLLPLIDWLLAEAE